MTTENASPDATAAWRWPCLSPIVRLTIESLDAEPGAWTPTIYGNKCFYITRSDGLRVWVANFIPGLDITHPKIGKVWGGISLLGTFCLHPSYIALWLAYRRWQRKRYAALTTRQEPQS